MKDTEQRKPTQCVIYARYSPRPDEDTSESNDRQIEICKRYADERGWEVMGIFEDKAKSRTDSNRAGLADAICALKPGWVVLCVDASRFGSSYTAMAYEYKVREQKGRVVFCDGHQTDPDDPWAMVIKAIAYEYAEMDRSMKQARTQRKMREHMRNGRKMGGCPPYGFRHIGDRIEIDEDEMQTVMEIMRLHKKGLTSRGIAKALAKQGILPRKGGRWADMTVWRIIERYKRAPEEYSQCSETSKTSTSTT